MLLQVPELCYGKCLEWHSLQTDEMYQAQAQVAQPPDSPVRPQNCSHRDTAFRIITSTTPAFVVAAACSREALMHDWDSLTASRPQPPQVPHARADIATRSLSSRSPFALQPHVALFAARRGVWSPVQVARFLAFALHCFRVLSSKRVHRGGWNRGARSPLTRAEARLDRVGRAGSTDKQRVPGQAG